MTRGHQEVRWAGGQVFGDGAGQSRCLPAPCQLLTPHLGAPRLCDLTRQMLALAAGLTLDPNLPPCACACPGPAPCLHWNFPFPASHAFSLTQARRPGPRSGLRRRAADRQQPGLPQHEGHAARDAHLAQHEREGARRSGGK